LDTGRSSAEDGRKNKRQTRQVVIWKKTSPQREGVVVRPPQEKKEKKTRRDATVAWPLRFFFILGPTLLKNEIGRGRPTPKKNP